MLTRRFADHFLQPGIKNLPSFIQDTKHPIKQIESINEKVEKGDVSLVGVAIVTLDVKSMYTNMTSYLSGVASDEYLHGGISGDQEPSMVKPESILKGLDLCLENNVFGLSDEKNNFIYSTLYSLVSRRSLGVIFWRFHF